MPERAIEIAVASLPVHKRALYSYSWRGWLSPKGREEEDEKRSDGDSRMFFLAIFAYSSSSLKLSRFLEMDNDKRRDESR